MSIFRSVLIRLGLANLGAERTPINVFVLDDDVRRHRWFTKRFRGDDLDIAQNVSTAMDLLSQNSYDAIFLDHDLLPEHYESSRFDDENTGYAIALWLNQNRSLQSAATIIVHTRNSEGGMRMVEALREKGRTVEYVPYPLLDMKIVNYWKR